MSIKGFYGFMLWQLGIASIDQSSIDELKEPILLPLREEAQRQLSYYRQRKMDLIARIATEWPRWGCGLDFYTFFIQPLLRNPLLLHFINLSDNIALSQINIKYGYVGSDTNIKWAQPKIEIKHGEDKKEIDYPNLVDYAISLLRGLEDEFQITPKTGNLQSSFVRVRAADIGVQSFFSFLEGLIRNAAKHRIRKGEEREQLEVRIVFCEDEERLKPLFKDEENFPNSPENRRFYYLLISANTDKLKDEQGNLRTIKEGDTEKSLLEFLKNQISATIIDATGDLTPANWGLKEMKICAAFLSGALLEEVNSENPSYLWVTNSPKVIWEDIDQDERIAYVIRLEKPRYMLAIVPKEKKSGDTSKWENQGIKVIEPAELEATDYDYDFLYLDDSVELSSNIERAILPQREIKNSFDLNQIEPMKFFYNVYDLHLKELIGGETYKICIYFEDDQKAESWQDWWSKNRFLNLQFVSPKKGEWNNCWNGIQTDRVTRKILILRHRGIANLCGLKRSKKLNKVCYQEYCSYSDPFFSFLYNIDPNSLAPLVLRQVIESAIINVLVIDERVAQVLTTAEVADASGKVRLEEKLYWMGIYVAKTVEVNGQQPFNYIGNASSERMVKINIKSILDGDGETFLEGGFPIHILLIHATKLNEIASALGFSNVDLISELKKHIRYVIVHSGRGKTKGDIPFHAPFLEYSIVQRYLLQEPSKFYLTQIALSSKGGE